MPIVLSNMIEPLRPYFVEDSVRSDNLETYKLGSKVNVLPARDRTAATAIGNV